MIILKIKYYFGRLFRIPKYLPIQIKLGEELNLGKLLNDSSVQPSIHLDDLGHAHRPVVTMSNFGLNGRFANQLFQYTFLRLVARRQSARLRLPVWAGSALFGLSYSRDIETGVKITKESDLSMSDSIKLMTTTNENFSGLDYDGYAQFHTSHYAADKDFIRSLFVFDIRLVNFFKKALSNIGLTQKKIITVHLRRGDYGYRHFFCAPCSWYEQWIDRQKYSPDEYIIYICSESPKKYRKRFSKFTVITSDDLKCPDQLTPYFDFMLMTMADVVATSNSSFSFFASMLNSKATSFFRPDFGQLGLVQFDPWNDNPSLIKELSPEQHKYLKSID